MNTNDAHIQHLLLERRVIETTMAAYAIRVPDFNALNKAIVEREDACEALDRFLEAHE